MSPASQSFRFRESRRLLREAAVRLSAPGRDDELPGLTRDIATGGMFVSTPSPMPVGTAAHFVLQLGSNERPADVEGEATVVWVRPEAGGADQPAGMGMRFNRVEPPGEERLEALFSERQREGDVIPSAPSGEVAAVDAPDAVEPEEPEATVAEEAAEEIVEREAADAVEPVEIVEPDPLDAPEPVEIVEAEPPDAPEPVEIVEAASEPSGDDLPAMDPPVAAEDAAGSDEAETPRVELFGDLAEDMDDGWMKPASASRPWLWPAVGGAVLLALFIVLRGPLMSLIGLGGAPTEEVVPAEAPGFELSTPRPGPGTPSADAGDSPAAGQPSLPSGEPVADSAAMGDTEASASTSTGETAMEPARPVAAERPAPAPPAVAVETGPPAEPTAAEPTAAEPAAAEPTVTRRPVVRRPLAPAAATPPANATALRSITASSTGDRTVIEIVGNAPFQRHHVMQLDSPPRLVVRLIGVRQDYDASEIRIPRLRGVRTGVHGRGATRNLHVVLDLAAPDIAASVERRGDRVVVSLSD